MKEKMNTGLYLLTAVIAVGVISLHMNFGSIQSEVKSEIFQNKCFVQHEIEGVSTYIASKIARLENIVENRLKEIENEMVEYNFSLHNAMANEKELLASIFVDHLRAMESALIGEVILTSSYHKRRAEALQHLVKRARATLKDELGECFSGAQNMLLCPPPTSAIAAFDGPRGE